MYLMPTRLLPELLNIWSKQAAVLAPQKNAEDNTVQLLPFTSGQEANLSLDYINFTKPAPDFSNPQVLFTWEKTEKNYHAVPAEADEKPTIVFGARSCDVAGLLCQDNFYMREYQDPAYALRRKNMVIAALNCAKAGEFCFCASTGSGPFVEQGADITVTTDGSTLLLEASGAKGREFLDMGLHLYAKADPDSFARRKKALQDQAAASFTRRPDLSGLEKALASGYNHPLWEENALACISCTGCTMLCPTCTCFTVLEERTGENSGFRMRCKDSCQTRGFTRNAGNHNPRSDAARFRYRILDKLAHVKDRFNHQGCVGCGRCIQTCPAGIDITDIAGQLKQSWEEAGRPEQAAPPPQRYEKRITTEDSFLYTPRVAVITKINQETRDIRRYTLRYKDARPGETIDLTGQFYMLTVFGVGEIAISIPFGDSPGTEIEFCIKKVGKVTGALSQLSVGDEVGLRGPYGRGFPYEILKKRDVLIVGSGVGLAPVRTIIVRMLDKRQDFGKIAVIASATSYNGLVYAQDLKDWSAIPGVNVMYALSKPTTEVNAHVGYINDLLPGLPFDWKTATALLCASPRRIKLVAADLLNLGMDSANIYTSLETHMRCGVGKCGHCKVGSHYMCVDGPVFNYKEMLELPAEF